MKKAARKERSCALRGWYSLHGNQFASGDLASESDKLLNPGGRQSGATQHKMATALLKLSSLSSGSEKQNKLWSLMSSKKAISTSQRRLLTSIFQSGWKGAICQPHYGPESTVSTRENHQPLLTTKTEKSPDECTCVCGRDWWGERTWRLVCVKAELLVTIVSLCLLQTPVTQLRPHSWAVNQRAPEWFLNKKTAKIKPKQTSPAAGAFTKIKRVFCPAIGQKVHHTSPHKSPPTSTAESGALKDQLHHLTMSEAPPDRLGLWKQPSTGNKSILKASAKRK